VGLKSDRVVIVTGASRGVGKGVALALAKPGDTVYVTGRAREEGQTSPLPGTIDATAAAISQRGGNGIAVACDHREDAQIKALIARAIDEQGRIDLLINNVYCVPDDLQQWQPFWQRPLDAHWQAMIDLGLRAHYVAAHCAAPHMVEQKSGMIVNISSPGARCYLHSAIYGMGKAATDKMSHDIGKELLEHRVAALSLWPGIVKTERIAPAVEADALPEEYAALKPGMESPEYSGRIIDAIAQREDYLDYSARTWWNAELGEALGVRDIDGQQPASYAEFMGSPATPSEAMIK